jgi:hypothetical protein
MKRFAVVLTAVATAALVTGAGCSKSAGSQEKTAAPAQPTTVGAGEKIAVPGGTGVPTMGNPPPVADSAPAAGTDSSFTLTVAPLSGAAGAASSGVVTIVPGKGFHVNVDFPVKLTLEPPAGVTIEKAVQEKPDAAKFDENNLIFNVKATAASAGTYAIKGKFKFAVCTASTCDPKMVPVEIALAVK